jgi:hypothetical protein
MHSCKVEYRELEPRPIDPSAPLEMVEIQREHDEAARNGETPT